MQLTIERIVLNDSSNRAFYPNGRLKGVFLQFISPAKILTSSGMENIYPGECILTFAGTPAEIVTHGDKPYFSNNNLWFTDEAPFAEAICQYHVPHHTIIRNVDFIAVNSLLNKIYIERAQQLSMYKEQIDLLMRELFIYLGRAADDSMKHPSLPRNDRLHLLIRELRKEMYLNPCQYPSVNSMADMVNISPSYFRSLYKTLFNVSPMQDLLNAKLESAKALLATTDNPISAIAYSSGFVDENYFARAFKTHVKMTPSEYRKQKNY